MIQTLHVPSWCGDFTLEREEGAVVLQVTDPTPAELDMLGAFLVKARKRKWLQDHAGVAASGTTKLVLASDTDLVAACKALLGKKGPKGAKRNRLIAVRSTSGQVTSAWTEDQVDALITHEETDPEPKTAVVKRRPTCCCPLPRPGPEQRASQVLLSFCDPSQRESYLRTGTLIAFGSLTGHAYRLAHRHHPVAMQQRRVIFDLDDSAEVHAHYTYLPPSEEVLGLKLVLEGPEHWVRNPSGWFGPGKRWMNPFVPANRQASDGTTDTRMMSSLWHTLQAFQQIFGPKA